MEQNNKNNQLPKQELANNVVISGIIIDVIKLEERCAVLESKCKLLAETCVALINATLDLKECFDKESL